MDNWCVMTTWLVTKKRIMEKEKKRTLASARSGFEAEFHSAW